MTSENPKSAISTDRPLWQPSTQAIKDATVTHFMAALGEKTGVSFKTYEDLWRWSTDNVGEFWSFLWDYCHVIGEKGDRALANEGDLMNAAFFPDAKLNYAQNMLKNADALGKDNVFQLRALLTERAGFNLRNLYSHGLLTDDAVHNNGLFMLWWLLLRMTLFVPWGIEWHRKRMDDARENAAAGR